MKVVKAQNKLEDAKNNAKNANKVAVGTNTDNPTTQINMLVEVLQNIKNTR